MLREISLLSLGFDFVPTHSLGRNVDDWHGGILHPKMSFDAGTSK